jgi:multidrug transporter EmrE-like cation transporter
MSKVVDYTIYTLIGLTAVAGMVVFAKHASPAASRVFGDALTSLMIACPAWVLVTSCRRHQWLVAALAALSEVIIASQILTPRASPLGRHEVGFVMVLPMLFFEKASLKGQKIAVVLGALLASCAVTVNAGIVGFGEHANTISWLAMGLMLSLVVLRVRETLLIRKHAT